MGRARGGTGKAGTAELQALEQRLVRLEQLVLLIAQQVGVPRMRSRGCCRRLLRQPEAAQGKTGWRLYIRYSRMPNGLV